MAGSLSEAERGDYARDGSVDLRGRPVLRFKKGGWTACYFVVGESKQIVFSSLLSIHAVLMFSQLLDSFYLQNSVLILSANSFGLVVCSV